ncbi:hypothetical protein GN244_ATG15943 [Phytophthora infestans]|uniref:Uncharacterized protein n=1 Tax=Phytophthora infestans TaxID=4787 RepID=A0A833SU95_PHYIN|nr:hypothetical protein GN244_ATG15943 [Phytophthora infestans]KAF4131142.1 hypothetical protein GN958_ATG19687 [Phytophthora infestans]
MLEGFLRTDHDELHRQAERRESGEESAHVVCLKDNTARSNLTTKVSMPLIVKVKREGNTHVGVKLIDIHMSNTVMLVITEAIKGLAHPTRDSSFRVVLTLQLGQ